MTSHKTSLANGSPGSPAAPLEPTCAQIAAETARHYGSMRFTMFTVFTSIAGALLVFPFTVGGSSFLLMSLSNRNMLAYAGIATSFLFALAEYRVSRLVVYYQENAEHEGAYKLPPGHLFWKWVVMLVMLCPPIISGIFWVAYLCGQVQLPRIAAT